MIKLFALLGDHDPVVPYQFGKMTHEYLKKMNPSPVFKTYRGVSHSSCEQVSPYTLFFEVSSSWFFSCDAAF